MSVQHIPEPVHGRQEFAPWSHALPAAAENRPRTVAPRSAEATVNTVERAGAVEREAFEPPVPCRRKPGVLHHPWAVGLIGVVLPLVVLLVWHQISASGTFSPVQLPRPVAVLEAGWELLKSGDLWVHVGISTQRVVLGFVIGGILGLALGALMGLSPWARAIGSPAIGALRAVPSLAWVPLLLLWTGIGENSKVTLVAIGAFFPVYTTVSAALHHVDRQLIEAARSFGINRFRLFTTVQLPAVLPAVISGLRLALAQSWLFLVAAELLGSSMGLGFLLTDSQNNGRTDRLLLAILLLAVLGKVTDALLGIFERWALRRWGVLTAR